MTSDVDFDAVTEALGLLASAVKSGEPWTDICEQKYKAALSCLQKTVNRFDEDNSIYVMGPNTPVLDCAGVLLGLIVPEINLREIPTLKIPIARVLDGPARLVGPTEETVVLKATRWRTVRHQEASRKVYEAYFWRSVTEPDLLDRLPSKLFVGVAEAFGMQVYP